MSAFLTLSSIAAATPSGRQLFADLDLAFGRERTGLVGRNGSGKSTLLRIAAGEIVPTTGSIAVNGRIAMLRQLPGADPQTTVADDLGSSADLALLARIVAGDGSEADLEAADWTIESRIEEALTDVGLAGLALDRPAASLSGGERTRLAIARLLIDAPDLLLLDEPTNNLDAAGRAVIAELIGRWRGGAVIASHDRALLERMDRIVELSATGARIHGGGWSSFVAARDAERAAAEAGLERAVRENRRVVREAQDARERHARRDRAGRAFAASGSAPRILLGAMKERAENSSARGERLADRKRGDADGVLAAARERIEVVTPLRLDLPPSGLPANRTLLRFDEAGWGPDGRMLFGLLSFDVTGPERVAVTGPNGAGKTSLLALAAGSLMPTSGRVTRAEGRVAMLDQHVGFLDSRATLLANLRRVRPELDDNDARAALARFAFRNDDALKPASVLSGGERMRAGLACTLSGKRVPQLLLLDEPTNHLDLDSIEVIEAALRGYDGALLAVSHDPAFLEAIGIERWIVLGDRS